MPESPREELARRLATYPKQATEYFENAFAVTATLSEASRKAALDAVISRFARGNRRISGTILQPVIGMNNRDAEQVATVYTLFIGLLGETQVSLDDFIESARGILFDVKHENIARSIAELICLVRPTISIVVEKAQLAGESLPSLVDVSFSVDLRVKIVDKRIKAQVPVALMHLDTDVDRDEIFVQLTRADVKDLIVKLEKCAADMEYIDTLKFQNG